MNKKGFTLIEVIAVIVILSLITMLILPNILNLVSKKRNDVSEATKNIIYDATDLYIHQYENEYPKTDNSTYCIKLEELVNDNKLTTPIIDMKTGKELSLSKHVKVIVKDKFNVEYELVDDCIEDKNEYVCKRATTLHTETCSQTDASSYCSGAGYTSTGSKGTTTITYGNLGTTGTLASGDAFDCDVTGNGNWQRFYYVTENGNNAVLIYYSNTNESGNANNTSQVMIAYNTVHNSTGNGDNWYGPETLITNLPSRSKWSNSKIISPGTRQIVNELGTNITANSGNTSNTIQSFTYQNKAARLLTYQEVVSACGNGTTNTPGYLDTKCTYLLENTKYSNSSSGAYGHWLETPTSVNSSSVFLITGNNRYVGSTYCNNTSHSGARPVIEVLKTDIDY